MPLAEERAEGIYVIRWVSELAIRIDDAEFDRSLLLMPDRVWREFPASSVGEIGTELVADILKLNPELLILGTGRRQIMPSPSLMAGFLSRGVGLEAMDNPAAARTYNLLALEGRRVAGVFLLG